MIIANPRKEKVTTEYKLIEKGVEMISYIYSFGIIGYKIDMDDNNTLCPFYLFIQHKKNKQWCFPKGRYENGENKYGFDTAKREFEEETGVPFGNETIKSIDWKNPYISKYEYKWKQTWIKKWTVLFMAELSSKAQPKIIRPKEINNIKWMTFNEFNKINKHQQYRDILKKIDNKLLKQINLCYVQNRKIALDIVNDIDNVINFLSFKLNYL